MNNTLNNLEAALYSVMTNGILVSSIIPITKKHNPIIAISTSEIKLSVIINEDETLRAVKNLHTIFELD